MGCGRMLWRARLMTSVVIAGFAGFSNCAVAEGRTQIRLTLTYEAKDLPLPRRHEQRLAAEIEALIPQCKEWPKRAEARITYALAATTEPRNNYQRIGERTEALRAYFLKRQPIARLWSVIYVSDADVATNDGDVVEVVVWCWQ